MPYILKKTNGSTLTTVQDASLDNSTSLTFVGRNYSGYGQPIEQNFVGLLENFSNTLQPIKPLQGQLWFNNDPNSQRMQVCFDGKNFRSITNIPYSSSPPSSKSTGDLWWDSVNNQIKCYSAVSNSWIASQPFGGASSSWDFSRIEDTISVERNSIKGYIGSNLTVIFSNDFYSTNISFSSQAQFPSVKAGITFPNADPVTGSSSVSTSTGYLLWGTAADSLKSQTVDVTQTSSASNQFIPFSNTLSGQGVLSTDSSFYYNAQSKILYVNTVRATLADLAERYEADAEYDFGTVLVIGGTKEVTIATTRASTAIAGIVSKNPSYLMNSQAGDDNTHPALALKGRLPCKVAGPIKKGDLLVSSDSIPGHACVAEINDSPLAIIGRALEDFDGQSGVIEVKV
jgi:hypothetical protein